MATKILNWITSAWPYIVAFGTVILALAGFAKLLLEIKRLKLQIQSLSREIEESSNLIKVASEQDIERFTSFTRDIEEKLSATRMLMREEIPEDDYSLAMQSAIGRLTELIEKVREESERARHYKRVEELQASFKPNEIQRKIFEFMRENDISRIDTETVQKLVPGVSKMMIYGAFREMWDIGIFDSAGWGDRDFDAHFSLSGFGARFISSYDKLPKNAD